MKNTTFKKLFFQVSGGCTLLLALHQLSLCFGGRTLGSALIWLQARDADELCL